MSLSKIPEPILNAFGNYIQMMYSDPIRTKAITSCIIASLGNATSQIIGGAFTSKKFDLDNMKAFALFGLVFGGTVPHYFFMFLEKIINRKSDYVIIKKLFIERIIYAPLFQVLSLYMLARFEGKNHDQAIKNMKRLFLPVLIANWKYLTLLQFVNLKFVPPMFRVLIVNFIGFFWSIYLANQRRKAEKKDKS